MENSLFKKEEKIISENKEILGNKKYMDNPMYEYLKKLYSEYKNLLRQMKQIMNISDNNQKFLRKIQNELQEEVKERKRVEEILEKKIDELNQVKARLEELSERDELTKIANRRRFQEVLESEWKRFIRRQEPISLIMIDIDFFKQYNDTYGHLAGDDCLQRVASAMKNSINRTVDFIARYGGEEFVVVLPGTDNKGANIVAENLRKAVALLSIPHKKSKVEKHVSISLGVATTIPVQEMGARFIVDAADKELYLAKMNGRNQISTTVINTVD